MESFIACVVNAFEVLLCKSKKCVTLVRNYEFGEHYETCDGH